MDAVATKIKDKKLHIFNHLTSSKNYKDKCDLSCFKLLNSAPGYFQLKIKESYYIKRLKPELNKQVEHVSLTLLS